MKSLEAVEGNGFLLTNGLGGYMALTAAFSVNRCDAGVLVAAKVAPNDRLSLVHRLKEEMTIGGKRVFLSSQGFADGTPEEDGYTRLGSFTVEHVPTWVYHAGGVQVTRRAAMAYEENAVCVTYAIDNQTDAACTLRITPYLRFTPKETAIEKPCIFVYKDGCVTANGHALYTGTNGDVAETEPDWQRLAYPEDEKDGRPDSGMAGACFEITRNVRAGEKDLLEIVFSFGKTKLTAQEMMTAQTARRQAIEHGCGLADPVARQLALAADAYITRRDSTGGKTVIAGYPLFGDWGRDTMIALPGLTLATKRYEDARSILRTFLAYERGGLVPNLFPEGAQQPMYNTVDAALLVVDSVWQYVQRTGDAAFAAEAYPTLKRIVAGYMAGAEHGIGMDADGLIYAGRGLDQVTWMDVCVEGILPTPRHGKPVEINAYWYSALRIMALLADQLGEDAADYAALAEQVRESFVKAFWREDARCLRDVISGTKADEQIRCNQIWAVTQPFTMLSPEQEKAVVDTVYAHLYTPSGLRTLSPEDAEYHGVYEGVQKERDMAYHQGTTWVFPLGAYFLAYLKPRGYTPGAVADVRDALSAMEATLREGCIGQLPEIYNGDVPAFSRGCFAQAWSVGEMLRVYEAVER